MALKASKQESHATIPHANITNQPDNYLYSQHMAMEDWAPHPGYISGNADNNASSRYFTSVCYSADGSCVLAGGNSKYVCIYEISQQILLKKFQVTFNRSLDGVLDEVRCRLFKSLACGHRERRHAMMMYPINVCRNR